MKSTAAFPGHCLLLKVKILREELTAELPKSRAGQRPTIRVWTNPQDLVAAHKEGIKHFSHCIQQVT
jgi:hypothetical protein